MTARSAPPTILVVEDESFVRDMMARDLREAGYQAEAVGSGAEAIALLELDGPIDCVVAGVRLPGIIDGWTVAERFREAKPDLPVIYVAGFPARDPRQVPGSVTIEKPYSPGALLRAVAFLLGR